MTLHQHLPCFCQTCITDFLRTLLCMTYVSAHAASAREECDETASDDVASTSGRSHVAGHQRATLCVSSQVGCIMGCTFCATGTMGIKGDLTAGEIVEQLVHAQRVTPIRNVVFMVSFKLVLVLCTCCLQCQILINRPWCRHQPDALHFIDAMLHYMEHIGQVWHMMRDIRMLGATYAHGNVAFGFLHTTLQIEITP